ncbi:hypothetical protein [Roseinatronobacter sp. NSM]|uniref:hypothetical protein n=1 Tax=Roseinatronobacter sp. NSM TaxID=3457785 RepID=UPI00403619B0
MNLLRTFSNRLTAALLALGLMVLGFGHQHAPALPADPMLAAYIQMGGELDDLCVTQDGPQGMAEDCPICTLAQIMAVSADALGSGVALRISTLDLPSAGHLLARLHSPRGPPARGPPLFLV